MGLAIFFNYRVDKNCAAGAADVLWEGFVEGAFFRQILLDFSEHVILDYSYWCTTYGVAEPGTHWATKNVA